MASTDAPGKNPHDDVVTEGDDHMENPPSPNMPGAARARTASNTGASTSSSDSTGEPPPEVSLEPTRACLDPATLQHRVSIKPQSPSSGVPLAATSGGTWQHEEPTLPTCIKHSTTQPSFKLDVSHYCVQGMRPQMEDEFLSIAHPAFNELQSHLGVPISRLDEGRQANVHRSFFAVFDGHGGRKAAEHCRENLPTFLAKQPSICTDPIQSLHHGILEMDDMFLEWIRGMGGQTSSGATAICAFLVNNALYIANVGDSRAVMCTNGKAIPLSVDHKPDRPDELARIKRRGGCVGRTEDEAIRNADLEGESGMSCDCWAWCCTGIVGGVPRVFPGGLAVSRSVGDLEMRGAGLVIADPEFTQRHITQDDDFLILACDGVWDVLSNQEAVDVVLEYIDDAAKAAQALVDLAYDSGSTDNISSIVIIFRVQS